MDSGPFSREISRRGFLAGTAGIAVAAATATATAGPAGAILRGAKNTAISPLVLSSDLYASTTPQRFVFAIARGPKFASFGPAQVAFAPPGVTEADVLDTNLYKEGLPKGRGIYVVDTVFPVAGNYKAAAIVGGKKVPFAITVKPAAEAPVVGAQAPRAQSPTPSNTMGVNPICTRVPACPLHDVSLSDVIGTGKPVVAMFATPQLCQSQYCGPVLDELLDLMAPYRDKMAMVHVEIYQANKGPNVAKQAPTVAAWGLPSEPWLFAIDGNGVIKTRLDGAIAENEIKTALDQLAA
jgi:hypothetical protein